MADYNINAVTRRAVFTGSAGLGPYAFTFEILDENDLAVYFNATKLTLTTDYTVSINANGTGSVTIVTGTNVPSTPTASDTITILGARDIERTTDFVTAGDLLASSLNEQLDALTIFDQQLAEEGQRSMRAPVFDPAFVADGGTLDMTLPPKADRVDSVMAFDTDGNPVKGPTVTGITTITALAADITTLADIEDGTVATDAISDTAAIASDVSTVAGVAANVTTVAGISADVTAVAGDATDIGTVATNIASVNTVATNIADVVTVANDLNEAISEIETAADDLNEAVSEIDTVATNIANVNAVGAIDSDVTTVAGISANVTTVAGISANVTSVAGVSSDVTAVAGITSDVTAVAGITSDVTTVAANISGVNSFADRYRVGASDPTTSLDEGDLAYNSTDNALKYFNGTSWASITAGLTDIVGDTTPQLGGNLDLNGNNITGSGDIPAANLTGTLPAIDGSALTGIATDVVDDTTPQLGGNLDVNGNSIVSASNGDINITPNGTGNVSLGNFTFDADQSVGVGQDDYLLTYNHSTTSISLEAAPAGGAGYFQGENGATGDTTNGKGDIFRVHEQQLDTNVTIASGDNAGAFFSLTVATGVTLTVNGNLVIA